MTASCQACLVGVPLIGTPAGTVDSPIGACRNCGSLTCGQHGHRDPAGPFVCIQCDTLLQASSAGYNAWRVSRSAGGSPGPGGSGPAAAGGPAPGRAAGDAGDQAAAALRALFPGEWGALVASFEEWAERRHFYSDLIALIELDLESMLGRLNQASDRANQTDTAANGTGDGDPGALTFADFALLWRRLDDRGRRLLAAALVMTLVMNLPAWSVPEPLRSIAKLADVRFRDEFPERRFRIPFEEYRYR